MGASDAHRMFEPTRVLVVGLVVTGVLATGAFAVQMWAQRLLPAQQVALLFAAEPAVAAWLAWYFLGETLDAQGWFGSAMILGGVLLGSWATGEVSPAHPRLRRRIWKEAEMAQKFGNSRWVQEGFLDNRQDGTVVGRVTFAVLGPVDFYLVGNSRGEVSGKVIRFRNSSIRR